MKVFNCLIHACRLTVDNGTQTKGHVVDKMLKISRPRRRPLRREIKFILQHRFSRRLPFLSCEPSSIVCPPGINSAFADLRNLEQLPGQRPPGAIRISFLAGEFLRDSPYTVVFKFSPGHFVFLRQKCHGDFL